MEPQLLIAAITIYLLYSFYENIKVYKHISKCFTKETKNTHNYITRLKAQILPKSLWINGVEGEYVSNLVEANQYWKNYFKRLLVATGIFFTTLVIIALPSIYYLLTH